MKKKMCKIFGHKVVDKKLIMTTEDNELKTFTAICSRCQCKLFGREITGELSGQRIQSFIEV